MRIITTSKKWVNGTELSYYCFKVGDAVPAKWMGSTSDRAQVDKAFEYWKNLGIGLNFSQKSNPQEATIRIGFDTDSGSWSYVGRDILQNKDPLQRTMNFGWDLSDAYGHDTALHEIGHSLGLEHEHQNPVSGIVWNEAKVKAYFSGEPNNWNPTKIEQNILRHLNGSLVNASRWDPNSIMHYAFAPDLIDQPEQYREGLMPTGGLSPLDIGGIRELYPPIQEAPSPLAVGLSQLLQLKPGDSKRFGFSPSVTKTYEIATYGAADTVLVLFENNQNQWVQIAGDDDGGEDRNAKIRLKLVLGRQYEIGLRLYYAPAPTEVSIMVSSV
jgi:hypothetical protein